MTPEFPITKKIQSFIAYITQTGTNAPQVTELLNTFNKTPIWTREVEGKYRITSNGLFTQPEKIIFPPTGIGQSSVLYQPINWASYGYYTLYQQDENYLVLESYALTDYIKVELNTIIGTSPLLIQFHKFN